MSRSNVDSFEPDRLWRRAREPLFWLGPALQFVWVNSAWEALTGYPGESVVGLAFTANETAGTGTVHDLATSFCPPTESLRGQPAVTTSTITCASGESISRRIEFWPFHEEDNSLTGVLGLVCPADSPAVGVSDEPQGLDHAIVEIRRQRQERAGFDHLIGSGPSHRRLIEQVHLAASAKAPVLIMGEPGTGKRQVARTIHQHSAGRHLPLVPFDCQALPPEILERELFGAEQVLHSGTGDTAATAGAPRPRLSLGEGASVLICEILMLPRDLQSRLAAALELPIRLLATTSIDPEIAVSSDQLRPDLYFALTTLVVRLLPLRQRREELPVLAQHFLNRANERGGNPKAGFTARALSALLAYDWPGNLRELARVVDHAHARQGDAPVDIADLPPSVRDHLEDGYPSRQPTSPQKPLDQLLTEVERRLIETGLKQSRGNKSRAAELLGISRPRLYRRIKELDLPDDGEPSEDPDSPK